MTTTRTEKWSPVLRRWEKKYGELYEDAILEIDGMTWPEVQALQAEIARLGQTNCSWLMFHGARDLLHSAAPRDESGMVFVHRNADEIRAARGLSKDEGS